MTTNPTSQPCVRTFRWLLTLSLVFAGADLHAQSLGSVPAVMLSPLPVSPLTGSTIKFTWAPGAGLSEIWLDVGTTPTGIEIYNASQGMGTAGTVTDLPSDGTSIYVRLWSRDLDGWTYQAYTYVAVDDRAVLVLPTDGGTLPGATAEFRWTPGGASTTNKWLFVGTSPGIPDLFNEMEGPNTRTIVTGLPTDGTPVHARLWSLTGATWGYHDYVFSAADASLANLITPVNGSAFDSTSVAFDWTSGDVALVRLTVGSTVGGSEFYEAFHSVDASPNVTNLPTNGSTVFARLWSYPYGAAYDETAWRYIDYAFTSVDYKSVLEFPTPGSTLPGSDMLLRWTEGNGVLRKWLYVGTVPGGSDIYNAEQEIEIVGDLALSGNTVSGVPTDGSMVYVRLWSLMASGWQSLDYSFRANDSTMATMTHPENGSTLDSIVSYFSWTYAAGFETWLYVGTTLGGFDLYNASQGTGTDREVSGLPISGRVYARLWTQQSGVWRFIDYAYEAAVEIYPATLYLPAEHATLPGATTTFQWWPGSGVSKTWLYVGTTVGGSDLYNADQGLGTQRVVAGLPTNGSNVHVRLWSLIDGAWVYVDYCFKAFSTSIAYMVTPVDGATLGGSSQTFTWVVPEGVDEVYLSVSENVGGDEIYGASQGTGTTQTVTGLPLDCYLVYVRLSSRQGEVWKFIDYHYQTAMGELRRPPAR